MPKTLDWERWLGPVAFRPYHPAYHPLKWRAWQDFGTGALGDMGCHILDPAFWALAWVAVAVQLAWILRRIGSFRWWTWALFPVCLLAFDVIFGVVCTLGFEHVIEE